MTERLVFEYLAGRDRVPAWPSGMGRPATGKGAQPFPPLGTRLLRCGPVTGGRLDHLPEVAGCPEPRATGLAFTSDIYLNRDAMRHPAIAPLLPRWPSYAYDRSDQALVLRAQPMSEALRAALRTERRHLGANVQTMPYGLSVQGGAAEAVVRLSGQPGAFNHFWSHSWGAGLRDRPESSGRLEIDFAEVPGVAPSVLHTTQHGNGIAPDGHRGFANPLPFSLSEGVHCLRTEWGPDWVRFLVDGVVVREDAKPDVLDPDARLYLVWGIGVGDQDWWATRPVPSSRWPFEMRVYRVSGWDAVRQPVRRAPGVVAPPVLASTGDLAAPRVGDVLTAADAVFGGEPPARVSGRRWRRGPQGGSQTGIGGASAAAYTIAAQDVGLVIDHIQTSTHNGTGAVTAYAARTGVVAA